MKKTLVTTSIALAIATAAMASHSDDIYFEDDNAATITDLKEGITFGAASIIGGLVAGPIGVMLGGIGGTVLGSELSKADNYELSLEDLEQSNSELLVSQQKISSLQEQLQLARQEHQQLEQLAMTNLEFQVLFHTGNDALSEHTVQRVDELAEFLGRNPELSVRLHGYADPRGSDEYNNVLSMHRAINVQNALIERGIDSTRIERRSYGADQSTAQKGNMDAYAIERRVSIEVFDRNEGVASVDNL